MLELNIIENLCYKKINLLQFLQETSIYNVSLLNKTKKQCLKIV